MEKLKIAELGPDDIVKLLHELYVLYSCSGVNSSTEFISSKNLFNFFNDCNISEQLIPKTNLELIVIKEKRKQKHITFQIFLEIIGKVSKAAYPDLLESSDAIYYFLDKHILTLFEVVTSEIEPIEYLDAATQEVLDSLMPMLEKLYRSEFNWEVYNNFDHEQLCKRSQKKMQKIVLNLKIAPDLVGHAKCATIWKMLISNSDLLTTCKIDCELIGTAFTFKRFLLYLLYCCSESSISKEYQFSERFLMFFSHVEAWLQQNCQLKFSLLKAPNLINQIELTQKLENSGFASNSQTVNLSEIRVSEVLECLETIFRIYSVWDAKLKKHYLNIAKYLLILSSANLIYSSKKNIGIQKTDAELIFFKNGSGGKNKSKEFGKLNFSQFFKVIYEISQKVYNDQEGTAALKMLAKAHLEKLTEHTYESDVRAVAMKLKEPNMLEIMVSLCQSLVPYSKFYMNESNTMSFENFLRFCKDFCVFPDLVPRKKLTPIFYTFASGFAKATMMLTGTRSLEKLLSIEDEYVEPEFINFEMFVECIAVCALESISINRTPTEKISAAIEKITQSPGSANISLKSGNTRSGNLERNDFLLFLKPEPQPPKPQGFLENLYNRSALK